MMRSRSDVIFLLLTKRPEKVPECLPPDWGDSFGCPIPKEDLYVPQYVKKCEECSFRIICNGCSSCGGCDD